MVSPLTDLLSKKNSRKCVWSLACNCAFNATKDLLCHTPVLSAPNFELFFKLQVDDSSSGAWTLLLQEGLAGVEHPVSYFSKKCTKCQWQYSTVSTIQFQ